MAVSKKTVSSGCSGSHGSPVVISYRDALAAMKAPEPADIRALLGECDTSEGIAELLGLSDSYARQRLCSARERNVIRAVQTPGRRHRWLYSLKDLHEAITEAGSFADI